MKFIKPKFSKPNLDVTILYIQKHSQNERSALQVVHSVCFLALFERLRAKVSVSFNYAIDQSTYTKDWGGRGEPGHMHLDVHKFFLN